MRTFPWTGVSTNQRPPSSQVTAGARHSGATSVQVSSALDTREEGGVSDDCGAASIEHSTSRQQ